MAAVLRFWLPEVDAAKLDVEHCRSPLFAPSFMAWLPCCETRCPKLELEDLEPNAGRWQVGWQSPAGIVAAVFSVALDV